MGNGNASKIDQQRSWDRVNAVINYLVDKQEIMIGLRDGIKLMRKNEKVSFLFPSHIAYGYLGDKNRIGSNVPIICTVTLTDFKKESIIKNNNNSSNQ